MEALTKAGIPETLLNTPELSTDGTFFCAIIVSKSKRLFPYTFDGKMMALQINVHGTLQHADVTGHGDQSQSLENPPADNARPVTKIFSEVQQLTEDVLETHPTAPWPTKARNPPPAYAAFHELTWNRNKINWKGILNESQDSTEECITSCDIWQPTSPMRITPDSDSLKCLFPSDTDCIDTLRKVETKSPGFAIASRTWLSFLPELDTLTTPPRHLCDILTVSRQNDVCLWVIVTGSGRETINTQLQYMLTVGKTIKHQTVTRNRDVPNFTIRCFLHSTHDTDNALIEHTLAQLGIKSIQEVLYQTFGENRNFHRLQEGIALLLLSKESHITTCAGDQRSVKLSAKQALTLLKVKGKRVSYVSSAPGTGKTLCGLSLYREFGKDHSVYVCPTEPLLQYLRHNGCKATLIRDDQQLCCHIEQGTFENKLCVIIDESHHLRCSRDGLEQLFVILKEQRVFLFVFADNEYQSFDRENQKRIEKSIFDLSMEVLGYYPEKHTFTEMYRNTRKIVSFVKYANEDTEPSLQDISCGNARDGDGIDCLAMDNLWENSPENGLVLYLRPLLALNGPKTHTTYLNNEVALLFDAGYTSSAIASIAKTLGTQFPRISTQTAEMFPRTGIVIDKIQTFMGLDATLCIFVMSAVSVDRPRNTDETIYNYRYRIFLATRATQKAVFIFPKIDTDVVQCMKFDYFPPQASSIVITSSARSLRFFAILQQNYCHFEGVYHRLSIHL